MLGLASARWGQSTKPGPFTASCNSNDLTMAGTAGAGGATRAIAHYYPVVLQPGAGRGSDFSLVTQQPGPEGRVPGVCTHVPATN